MKIKKLILLVFKNIFLLLTVLSSLALLFAQFNIFISESLQIYILSIFAFGIPYFFIVNIIFLLYWSFAKKWYFLIPLLSIILSSSVLKNIVARPQIVHHSKQNKIKILSWNVGLFNINKYKKEPEFKDSMIEFLKNQKADIICLQEMVAADDSLKKKIINQIQNIAEKINKKYYYFAYNTRFDFDDRHHYGNCIFSDYPIIDSQTVAFDSLIYNNNFQFADIQINNKTLRVFNFHLQSLKLNEDDHKFTEDPNNSNNSLLLYRSKSIFYKIISTYKKRTIQAQAIHTLIESTETSKIVCGDLNDVPSSYAYFIIKEGLKDAFLNSGKGLGKTFRTLIPTLRIDFILYDKSLISEKTKVIPLPYSDHYPIISEFSY